MNSRNGHLTGLVVDAYLSRKIQSLVSLGRDPEKWVLVFRKDHARTKR
jgi:hypothetical protein